MVFADVFLDPFFPSVKHTNAHENEIIFSSLIKPPTVIYKSVIIKNPFECKIISLIFETNL